MLARHANVSALHANVSALHGGAQLPAFAARITASITAELDREWLEQAGHALYAAHARTTLDALHVRHIEQEGQSLTTT